MAPTLGKPITAANHRVSRQGNADILLSVLPVLSLHCSPACGMMYNAHTPEQAMQLLNASMTVIFMHH